jgi:acetyltransferase-like isoleucine patch superfamily enzyme
MRGKGETIKEVKKAIQEVYFELRQEMMSKYNRHVSFGDLFTDRWETARSYGFGEGTSCYDNVLILGDVKVGENTWIGPGVILDGDGGLEIGDYCSIGAGVQIYSHHSVRWAISLGVEPIDKRPTKIGSGVFIGPNTIIQMGVTIGDTAIIGACQLVSQDVPAGSFALSLPRKRSLRNE